MLPTIYLLDGSDEANARNATPLGVGARCQEEQERDIHFGNEWRGRTLVF